MLGNRSSGLPDIKRPGSAQVRAAESFGGGSSSSSSKRRPQSAQPRNTALEDPWAAFQPGNKTRPTRPGGGTTVTAGGSKRLSSSSSSGALTGGGRVSSAVPTGGILGGTGIYSESQRPPVQMSESARIRYLQDQLLEIKKETHALKQKQMKLAARQKLAERQLGRRDKSMKQVADSASANAPVPVGLLENLKQLNHNGVGLYKRKRAELESHLQEKDARIAELKKEPLFTKIVELEAILTCYQNEFTRLQRLQRDSQGHLSDAGQEEIEVLKKMVTSKNAEVDALIKRKTRQAAELEEAETDYAAFMEEYKTVEDGLNGKHAEVKKVYDRFKKLLEDVKRKEQMRKDLEQVEEDVQACDAQLVKAEVGLAHHASVANRIDRAVVSECTGSAQSSSETEGAEKSGGLSLSGPAKNLLHRMKRRSQARGREDPTKESMLQLFQEADADRDGQLSNGELLTVLEKMGVNVTAEDVSGLMRAFGNRLPQYLDILILASAQPASDGDVHLLSSLTDVDVEDLRMGLKRAGISYVTFRDKLLTAKTYSELATFLGQVISPPAVAKWSQVNELFGAGMILMRVHSWM
ncbi:unnamed protein product [Amoebophrya sp. A25]|nr:unnamed protein product [Amoebophrya sp. A25]|eukprot:GSA25T00009334001.1